MQNRFSTSSPIPISPITCGRWRPGASLAAPNQFAIPSTVQPQRMPVQRRRSPNGADCRKYLATVAPGLGCFRRKTGRFLTAFARILTTPILFFQAKSPAWPPIPRPPFCGSERRRGSAVSATETPISMDNTRPRATILTAKIIRRPRVCPTPVSNRLPWMRPVGCGSRPSTLCCLDPSADGRLRQFPSAATPFGRGKARRQLAGRPPAGHRRQQWILVVRTACGIMTDIPVPRARD